jgi:hypothetical protein
MSLLSSSALTPAWSPQRGSQVLFMSCPVFEVLYEGTRGPGKTDALIMDFAQDVGKGYGEDWRGILFRRSRPELRDIIAKTRKWFKKIFPSAQYNKVEKTWTWPDGEQLILAHIRNESDYWSYHGHAYPWIAFEELTTWPDDGAYRKMMSCCRSSNPLVPRKYRATCNPYGPGHNWVKRRFRLPGHRGIVIRDAVDSQGLPEPERVAIHGNIIENQILLQADPGYISRIRASARNASEAAAWIEGRWDIVSGGMFDDMWDAQVNVLDPFEVPASWRVSRSFDWGSSRPFSVGWWARSDGTPVVLRDGRVLNTVRGDVFRIAEWYGANPKQPNVGLYMKSADIAAGILQREVKMRRDGLIRGPVHPGPADSAIWSSVPGTPSIEKDMRDAGVMWEKADKSPGSRKQGWEQIRTRLKNSHRDERGMREKPGLFVFRTCHDWISTVPTLPRDDRDLDDIDTESEDHQADETRYYVMETSNGMRQGGF